MNEYYNIAYLVFVLLLLQDKFIVQSADEWKNQKNIWK